MSAVSKETKLDLYKSMVRIRVFERRSEEMFLAGNVPGFLHLYIGEEAIATAVCANLNDDDKITSHHRGHGHCLAKGGEMKYMLSELLGKETGYCHGRGGSMHIADVEGLGILGANGIVGAGIVIAAGAAFGMQYRKTNQVAVAFFGDGAVNRGTFHEGFNFASIRKLPVVFVCENNNYAISTDIHTTTNIEPLSKRAEAYGMVGKTVDGNDVMAVYEAAKEAIEYARSGQGPVFLECKTWRQEGHCIGENQEKYKDMEVQRMWVEEKDPIKLFEAKLLKEKTATKEELEAIWEEARTEMREAEEFAANSPEPDPADLLKYVYAD